MLPVLGDDRLADRAVGVDGVAAVDEEVRLAAAHGLVDLHAAEVRVDAPALPGGVAAPDEAQVGRVPGPRCQPSSPSRAGGGVTKRPTTGSDRARALASDWKLTRTKTSRFSGRPVMSCRAVKSVPSSASGPTQPGGLQEAAVEAPLDDHARGPVGAAPDQHRALRRVAELQALQCGGARGVRGDEAGCRLGHGPMRQAWCRRVRRYRSG